MVSPTLPVASWTCRNAGLSDVEYDVTSKDLSAAIDEDENPSWNDVNETMEGVLGVRNPSDCLVLGFVEGVSEVFAEV